MQAYVDHVILYKRKTYLFSYYGVLYTQRFHTSYHGNHMYKNVVTIVTVSVTLFSDTESCTNVLNPCFRI